MAENNSSAPLKTAEGAATLWCVHVTGADDVHPMPSREVALEEANALNTSICRIKRQDIDPVLIAVVAEWPHSADSHAAGLMIRDECLRMRGDQAVEAQAAPAAVAVPEWDKVRRGLAMVMLGFAGRSDCTESAAEAVLDAATEPGMPLEGLRTPLAATPALPATEPAHAAVGLTDALRDLIEAIEYTPLGIRQIKALERARAAIKTDGEIPATEDSSAGDLAEEKISDEMSREERMIVLQRDSDGTPTVWCDPEIADIVCALNSGGVKTVASCSGHGVKPGGVALADGRQLLLLESLEAFNSAMSAITQAEVQAGPVAWMRKTDITELTDSEPETNGWTPLYVAPQAQPADALDWAVQRWNDEVRNRPLVNIHRRSLDNTWRQVITYLGGDAEKLIGPSHDDLLAAAQEGGNAAKEA